MLYSQLIKQSLNDSMNLSAEIFFSEKKSIPLEYKGHAEILLLWTYNLLIYYALKVKSKNTL